MTQKNALLPIVRKMCKLEGTQLSSFLLSGLGHQGRILCMTTPSSPRYNNLKQRALKVFERRGGWIRHRVGYFGWLLSHSIRIFVSAAIAPFWPVGALSDRMGNRMSAIRARVHQTEMARE